MASMGLLLFSWKLIEKFESRPSKTSMRHNTKTQYHTTGDKKGNGGGVNWKNTQLFQLHNFDILGSWFSNTSGVREPK